MNKKLFNIFLWLSFTIISISGIIFSYKYFSKAMPLISLDVKMDRKDALAFAKKLAKVKNLGPSNFQQSVKFSKDQKTKIFVELENGGKNTFIKMMNNNYFMPYTWDVRHFKENEKNEILFRFTPEGKPYGFIETLSEDTPGKNISAEQAQKIAEAEAQNNWNINLNLFNLIEPSTRTMPSKRIDHMFIYERNDTKLKNGSYRLKIIVSGDKVTTLIHFVKIPENFIKKYQKMRSYNNTIAFAGSLIMILLYVIGGCIFGLLYLFKKQYILWKKAFLWAILLSFLKLLSSFNNYSLIWMSYNTALPTINFLFSFIFQSIISSIGFFLGCFLLFIAAESLTRKAFKQQPQFWKLWSFKNANSLSVIKRTYIGYLMVPIFMSIVVATYFFATKFLGWWSPSDAIIEPNILATYAPWLEPVTLSLCAGFLEECLFRAVPLSCAAILGKYFEKQKLWIFAGFILQILVFGAAHANYATQPAYARVIELIIPSTIFGFLYLLFGLLPAIISHFIFDLVLMSLPIFTTSGLESFLNKSIIIFIGSIPMLIVLLTIIKKRGWSILSKEAYNKAWTAPQVKERKIEIKINQKEKIIPQFSKKLILLSGIISAILWIFSTKFIPDSPHMSISKNEAIVIAKETLKKRNIYLSKEKWKIQPHLESSYIKTKMQHKFIWQIDKNLYKDLFNSYLKGPYWSIKFANFNGSIDEKTEEYTVIIDHHGKPSRFIHKNPEIASGKNLNIEQARKIAIKSIISMLTINKENITEISATKEKKPNRTDWIFIYSKQTPNKLNKHNGELRIYIKIDGNKVIDMNQYVHVPEQWRRNETSKGSTISIIASLCSMILIGICIVSLLLNSFITIPIKNILRIFTTFIVLYVISIINNWQSIFNILNTSEPLNQQLFRIISMYGLNILIKSSILSYILVVISKYKIKTFFPKNLSSIIIGLSNGFIIAGAHSFIYLFQPSLKPIWGDYNSLESYSPILNTLISTLFLYIFYTLQILLLCMIINKINSFFNKNKWFLTLLFISITLLVTSPFILNISFWILHAIGIGIIVKIIYNYSIIYDFSIVPLSVASFFMMNKLQHAIFNIYPYAFINNIFALLSLLLLAIIWFNMLNKKTINQ